MNRLLASLVLLAALLFNLPAFAAACFWVGGTGNWDGVTTTTWANASGGTASTCAGPGGVPGVADSATFDGASGGGIVTVTATQSVLSITSGAHTGAILVAGQTITTGSWSGTGSATRTLSLLNGTINLTGANATVWNFTTVTGLTFVSTGSTIKVQGASGAFTGGGLSYGTLNYTGGGSGAIVLRNTNTFVNLSFVAATTIDTFITAGATTTVTGTLTLTGMSPQYPLWIHTDAIGTNRSFSAANPPVITNVVFQNITGAGVASPFTGTAIGDFGSNSGITTTTPKTVYYVGQTGSASGAVWATSSGGTGSTTNYPMPQDTITFDGNSFTAPGQIFTQDTPFWGNLDFTGVTNNPSMNTTLFATYYVGNFKWAVGMTAIGSVQHNWVHTTGTKTYTANGVRIIGDIQLSAAPAATLQFADDPIINENLIINTGTIDAANHNPLIGVSLVSNSALVRALLMGSGTWTFTKGTSGTVINIGNLTGFTLTAGTSTIKLLSAAPGTGTRTIALGGLTYNNFWWAETTANAGGAGIVAITGANTFADFKVSKAAPARQLTLPAATTQTVTTIELDGSSSALLTVRSSVGASAATISDTSGSNLWTYLSVQDITASGGATFTACQSVNVSGNTGITFGGSGCNGSGGSGYSPLLLLGVGD